MKLKLLMTIGLTVNGCSLSAMEKISVDSLSKSFEEASKYLSTLGEKPDDVLSMVSDGLCAFRKKLKHAEKEHFQFCDDIQKVHMMAAHWKRSKSRYQARLNCVSIFFNVRLKEYGKMSTKPEYSGKLEFVLRNTLLSLELLETSKIQLEKINSIVTRIPTPKI